eukprot:6078086-Pyramimonas_sp.AAC.1
MGRGCAGARRAQFGRRQLRGPTRRSWPRALWRPRWRTRRGPRHAGPPHRRVAGARRRPGWRMRRRPRHAGPP